MKEESNNVRAMADFEKQSEKRRQATTPLPTAQQKTHAQADTSRQGIPPSPTLLTRTAASRFAQAVPRPLAGLLVNIVTRGERKCVGVVLLEQGLSRNPHLSANKEEASSLGS